MDVSATTYRDASRTDSLGDWHAVRRGGRPRLIGVSGVPGRAAAGVVAEVPVVPTPAADRVVCVVGGRCPAESWNSTPQRSQNTASGLPSVPGLQDMRTRWARRAQAGPNEVSRGRWAAVHRHVATVVLGAWLKAAELSGPRQRVAGRSRPGRWHGHVAAVGGGLGEGRARRCRASARTRRRRRPRSALRLPSSGYFWSSPSTFRRFLRCNVIARRGGWTFCRFSVKKRCRCARRRRRVRSGPAGCEYGVRFR